MFSAFVAFLAIYGGLMLMFLIQAAVKEISGVGCHETFHVSTAYPTATEGCYKANNQMLLSSEQGWSGAKSNFTLFHSHRPSAEHLVGDCQPAFLAEYTLGVVESRYIIAKGTNVTSVSCSEGDFCLIKANYSDKHWNIATQLYPAIESKYPTELESVLKKTHHLVIKGPASGDVMFTAIQYQVISSYHNRMPRHASHTKSFTTTKSCQVTLENGAPDGIFSFNPATLSA